MGQRLHRKSLMQGILSVASGEGRKPDTVLKEGKKLPGYLTADSEDRTYSIPDCCYKSLADPDEFYENKVLGSLCSRFNNFAWSEMLAKIWYFANSHQLIKKSYLYENMHIICIFRSLR